MKFYDRLTTDFCSIVLVSDGQNVTGLHLDTGEGKRTFVIKDNWVRDADVLSEASEQVREYCRGNLRQFSIPVQPEGTEFQKRIWRELGRIPFGEVRSYGQVAFEIGNAKGARAVGAANGKNPIPLIIPCHRVIGADGSLTGFAHGLTIKEKLLEFERQQLKENR